MTSKERVAHTLDHERPDRVPIDYAAWDHVTDALMRHLGLDTFDELMERLGVDLRWIAPRFKDTASEAHDANPTVEARGDLHTDIWGVGFASAQKAGESHLDPADSPLAEMESEADLDAYPWPTADLWDCSDIAEQAKGARNRWIWTRSRGMVEISCQLRGFDAFMDDLGSRPGRASALMDRVMSYLVERTKRVLEAGRGLIDMVEYNDDVGGQEGPFISPAAWREHIKPRMSAFVRMCKGYGAAVRYRSSGGIRPIIPDLIEMEVDVLSPVQPTAAGMDPEELKRDYNEMITLNGGIDTQGLVTTAGRDEVRSEVRRLIDTLGHNGGYILGPSSAFQPDLPLENVLAVYEAALGKELG